MDQKQTSLKEGPQRLGIGGVSAIATHEWPDRRLKRTDFTASDSHLLPAELPHDEAVETLVVGAAIVPQEPERLLLADKQAADTVGAVMDASSIAAKRDVAGQLVDLIAEGERGATPEFPRRAICRGLHRVWQNVIGIEKGFEDRGASACIAGMGRGV